ncbi:MAG: hypothetical protein K6U74_01965 [Firmicutes bacterium]|nr:hypothetical protein [Bacillota bacterium]
MWPVNADDPQAAGVPAAGRARINRARYPAGEECRRRAGRSGTARKPPRGAEKLREGTGKEGQPNSPPGHRMRGQGMRGPGGTPQAQKSAPAAIGEAGDGEDAPAANRGRACGPDDAARTRLRRQRSSPERSPRKGRQRRSRCLFGERE